MAVLNNDTQVVEFLSGLDHPEGIAWGLNGKIYAGGEAGQIYEISFQEKSMKQLASVGDGFVAGLALDANSNIYACDVGNANIQKITPDGKVTPYSAGNNEYPFRIPNYPVFDNSGNLYVSDSGEFTEGIPSLNGNICKIKPGGNKAEIWENSLNDFPNGMCMDPTNNYLYVVLSFNRPGIYRIPILSNGTAGKVETVLNLPKIGVVPDGIAFDQENNLYISCYRPDRIYRLKENGQLEIFAEELTGHVISAPTNIAFCGKKREKLISANLGRWHLTEYETTIPGISLNYPTI